MWWLATGRISFLQMRERGSAGGRQRPLRRVRTWPYCLRRIGGRAAEPESDQPEPSVRSGAEGLARGRDLEVITEEICFYKRQAGTSFIEIGRRLNEAKAQLPHGSWLSWLRERVDISERSGVSLERGRRYLQGFDGRGGLTLRAAPQFWLDYLTAAKTLKYDLSRDDVRLPKNLRIRHDQAAAAGVVSDKKARKNMEARYTALHSQFEFSADGLCIRVPASIQEIVDEGRALRHCVGGYAERHMKGTVAILFLRKLKNPEAPYVTMELTTERNCQKLRIVQLHGFGNDRKSKEPPEVRHAEFLRQWLEWVYAGSRRDKDGHPVLPERKQETESA